jgi:hypothetical protein
VTKAVRVSLDEALQELREAPRGRSTIEETVRMANNLDGWIECIQELQEVMDNGGDLIDED